MRTDKCGCKIFQVSNWVSDQPLTYEYSEHMEWWSVNAHLNAESTSEIGTLLQRSSFLPFSAPSAEAKCRRAYDAEHFVRKKTLWRPRRPAEDNGWWPQREKRLAALTNATTLKQIPGAVLRGECNWNSVSRGILVPESQRRHWHCAQDVAFEEPRFAIWRCVSLWEISSLPSWKAAAGFAAASGLPQTQIFVRSSVEKLSSVCVFSLRSRAH